MSYVEDRLQEIADAIREKEGSVDPIPAPEFPSRILGIQTGIDTSDATATPEDILERKTAYVNGVKIRGTMENIGVATPSITVEPTTGVITATTVQNRGFIDAATKSASKQLDTQAGKTVTPTTINRTAVARGLYTTGDVIVAGDANLIPNNIRDGVSIFGVNGTMTTESGVSTADATATASDIRTGVTAYIASGRVNGAMPNAGTIDGNLGTTGNANWSPSNPNVGSGTVTITNVQQSAGYTGGFSGGTITVNIPANRLLKGRTVTPTTTAQQIAAAEDIAYGAISVAGDANLVPANIKNGVTIFGVTGTASAGGTDIDTSDATATSGDIAWGKTAYVNGQKISGDVPTTLEGYSSNDFSFYSITTFSDHFNINGKMNADTSYGCLYRTGSFTGISVPKDNFGNATAADVAYGKTFTSSAGIKVTGTATSTAGGFKLISKSYNSKVTTMTITSSDLGSTTPDSISRCYVIAQGDQSGAGCITSVMGMPASSGEFPQIMVLSNSSTTPKVEQNIDNANKTFTVDSSSLTIKSPTTSHFFLGLYTVIVI